MRTGGRSRKRENIRYGDSPTADERDDLHAIAPAQCMPSMLPLRDQLFIDLNGTRRSGKFSGSEEQLYRVDGIIDLDGFTVDEQVHAVIVRRSDFSLPCTSHILYSE